MDLKTSFDILGIGPQTDAAQAKRAYKGQVRRWHPDQFPEGSTTKAGAEERLKQINIAYARIEAHLAMQRPVPGTTDSVSPSYPRQDTTRRPEPPKKRSKKRSWVDHLFEALNTFAGRPDNQRPTAAAGGGAANRPKTFEQVLDEMGGAGISPKPNRPSASPASRCSGADYGHFRRKGATVGAVGGAERPGPVKPVGRVRAIGKSR